MTRCLERPRRLKVVRSPRLSSKSPSAPPKGRRTQPRARALGAGGEISDRQRARPEGAQEDVRGFLWNKKTARTTKLSRAAFRARLWVIRECRVIPGLAPWAVSSGLSAPAEAVRNVVFQTAVNTGELSPHFFPSFADVSAAAVELPTLERELRMMACFSYVSRVLVSWVV